ncbi:hypothetical protein SAMN05892883_3716 [Jatrophihabitans sp. GAS493]|uniref:MmcQ/YjbR family DNA-binding protein n=1 Tax=Jatrophihabitans sp. GAS493 TaxID=1907575 RepID=UPI000BB8A337|nr:hypothetical protein [Jatrophihabitans sp. GAS493]SOD74530.1 hypothetical protein SAMN05892883_3716 [Jatrophihabitans sp. GAS493]
MASWDDIREIVAALPTTSEDIGGPTHSWRAGDKNLVWERPLRRGDVAALEAAGQPVPAEPILAVRTADLGVKEALLADDPDVYFTTPHFDNYPAVLIQLERIDAEELRELIVDAWLARVPKRRAMEYLESRQ